MLHDCLARKQHICMLQRKLKAQVEHLLCQTAAVTCLGNSHASCALHQIASPMNISLQSAYLQTTCRRVLSPTDGRDSDAVAANSSYMLATGEKFGSELSCGQDVRVTQSISVFDSVARTMVYCGIGVAFGYVPTPWTFLPERIQARIMPFVLRLWQDL
ncbi:TPA: hypothetical protein ACH3X1_005096 [Trebouxia sp. C0004]